MIKTSIFTVSILMLSIFSTIQLKSQALIDLESGFVFNTNNDVRIPGDKGTYFSLNNDLQAESKLFYRLRAAYTINSRHTISLLYAPLNINSEGSLAYDIKFQDVIFPANTQLNGKYKFNSYRITYRYRIISNSNIDFGLGFTAKIRDAKISLSSSALNAEKTNVGFVPIINFRFSWKINDKFGLLLDGDALAAPQGRAEDVIIAARYKLSDNFAFRAGYRILEGGADNDEVYNFAFFQYASVGVSYTFK